MIKKLQENKNKIIFILIVASLAVVLLYSNNLQSLMPVTDNLELSAQSEVIPITQSNTPIPTIIQTTFYIEVLGEVKNPGVFEVSSPILVFQAIELAGGYTDKADITFVHQFVSLSKKVSPELKIYIPPKGLNANITTDGLISTGKGDKFYINNATSSELEDINGIGKVTADKIIKNRPFSSWEELKAKTGIRQTALEELQSKAIL